MKKLLIIAVSLFLLASASQTQAATYTVNTTIDDNGNCSFTSCSIREAINKANSNPGTDVIYVAVSGVHTLTLTSGSSDQMYGDLDINPNGSDGLIIEGSKHNLVIDASAINEQAITVHAGNVSMNEVTVTGGVGIYGGGIVNNGALILSSCNIGGNTAYIRGGGIYNTGYLTIKNYSFVMSNTSGQLGAGVYTTSGSSLTIESSSYITGNTASDSGAGVYAETGSTVSLSAAHLESNIANNHGGGLYAEQGTTLSVSSSFIENNSAVENGGGAYVDEAITFSNSTILGNSAKYGGGAYAASNGRISVNQGSVIEQNSSQYHGAGLYSEGDLLVFLSTIDSNVASNNGGGLYGESYIFVGYSDVTNNSAAGNQGGGGIYADDELVVRNSTISGNTSANAGGGITAFADTSIFNSTVTSNTANGSGAGMYNYCRSTASQNIRIESSTFEWNTMNSTSSGDGGSAVYSSRCTTYVDATTFQNNTALYGSTFQIRSGRDTQIVHSTFDQNTARAGGGVYASYTDLLIIEDSSFDSNQLQNWTSAIHSVGGTIYVLSTDTEIYNTEITNNTSMGGNAGIYSTGASGSYSLLVDTVTLDSNIGGDTLFAGSVDLELYNSTLTNNVSINSYDSLLWYPIVYAANASAVIQNTTVSGNQGTGVKVSAPTTDQVNIENSTIIANTGEFGGISHGTTASNVFVRNSIVDQNTDSNGNLSDVAEYVTSLGYNLIGAPDSTFTADSTDQIGVNPQLSALANNGGSTQTHALQSASPAVDAIPVASCTDYTGATLTTDQRGSARPSGSACDIGAYEL